MDHDDGDRTDAGRPAHAANLRDLAGGGVISAGRGWASALGPTIDDLVSVAQTAGLPKANRRTIRGMVERKLVVSPGRVGRSWRYQNVALGQVESVSRHRSRDAEPHLMPLVVFVETGTGDLHAIRALACELLQAWEVELAADLARLHGNPSALTAEVARAARMRRDAPLPRRVRTRLEDRELAMLYGFAQMLGTPLPDHVAAEGAYQFERLLGLRSGRVDLLAICPNCCLAITSGGWIRER